MAHCRIGTVIHNLPLVEKETTRRNDRNDKERTHIYTTTTENPGNEQSCMSTPHGVPFAVAVWVRVFADRGRGVVGFRILGARISLKTLSCFTKSSTLSV